jgi:hypothetical protein
MTRHFRSVPEGIEMSFDPEEVQVLSDLPRVLAGLGDPSDDPGAARLSPHAYRDDDEADAEWRRYAGGELQTARSADRSAFQMVVQAAGEGPVVISVEEAGAFLRVVNEVRLVLGARWGLEAATDYDDLRPEARDVLGHLGWVVEDLAEVLTRRLDDR